MTLLNMTPNISGMINHPPHQAKNQAASLPHHNLGHRPKTEQSLPHQAASLTHHNLGHRPKIKGSPTIQATSLTYHNLGHRPKIKISHLCK